jgi:hypothetical protein
MGLISGSSRLERLAVTNGIAGPQGSPRFTIVRLMSQFSLPSGGTERQDPPPPVIIGLACARQVLPQHRP